MSKKLEILHHKPEYFVSFNKYFSTLTKKRKKKEIGQLLEKKVGEFLLKRYRKIAGTMVSMYV